MNTREIALEYRLTHWAQIMHERSESGLSVKAFCEKVGMRENVFYYYYNKDAGRARQPAVALLRFIA